MLIYKYEKLKYYGNSKKKKKNESKLNICMCSIVKEENKYINDFINHYKLLGYKHFFIYDNNDKDGEILEEVLKNEIQLNLLTIVDYKNYTNKRHGPQMDAYYNCYQNNKNKCNWISFFDIDEYLILENKNISLGQLLEHKRYSNCEGILLNWKIFHDNNLLEYQNISVTKRFTGVKKGYRSQFTKIIDFDK